MTNTNILLRSFILLILMLFFINANAQLSGGVSYGYFHSAKSDFEFKGSSGTTIDIIYRINKFRFGLSYTFIKDMNLDESWALGEFNRTTVISNSGKLQYEPALGTMFQFNILNGSDKVDLFIGGEIGIFEYNSSGIIEMSSGSSSTTVELIDSEPGSVVLFGLVNLEYNFTPRVITFLEAGLPLSSTGGPILKAQFGLLFNITKANK